MGVLKMLRLCLLVLGFLLVEGVDIQDATNTNTKLFTGNQALDSGTLGFGLGVGASVLGSALLGGGCGRRKRDAQGDTRLFLGGNNCGNNFNSYPSNNYNNYPSNNYNQYPSNNHGSHYNTNQCSCTSLSFTDHYGNINGNCRSHDAGKGSWCYTTGWNSGCSDLQSSSRFDRKIFELLFMKNLSGSQIILGHIKHADIAES